MVGCWSRVIWSRCWVIRSRCWVIRSRSRCSWVRHVHLVTMTVGGATYGDLYMAP